MIRKNSHLRFARYHQHLHELLDLDQSPLEYMMQSFPEVKEKEEMRKIIGRYGLTGRQQVTLSCNALGVTRKCRHCYIVVNCTNYIKVTCLQWNTVYPRTLMVIKEITRSWCKIWDFYGGGYSDHGFPEVWYHVVRHQHLRRICYQHLQEITLKMSATVFSKMLIPICQTVHHHIPEELDPDLNIMFVYVCLATDA
jgi:hypothetical protein